MVALGASTTKRRVRRIIRKVDPWTVLKVSSVLSAIAALGLVLVAVAAWAVLHRLGVPDALERAAERVSLVGPGENVLQSGATYLRGLVFLSAGWMMMTTGLMTAGAILYNLFAEVVGGVEFTVYEEVPVDTAAALDNPGIG